MDVILACVDLTPRDERALSYAAELGSRLSAELVVLYVAPAEPEWVGWGPGPRTVRDSVAAELRRAHRDAQALAESLRSRHVRVKALTVQGPVPETILEQAEALGASMIVLGAHSRGAVASLVLGSVARHVMRRATRPVLVVPDAQR